MSFCLAKKSSSLWGEEIMKGIENGLYMCKLKRAALVVLLVGVQILSGCGQMSGTEPTIQTIQPIEPESIYGQNVDNNSGENAAQEQGKISITISAAGDVTMGNYVGQDYAWSFKETYDTTGDKGYFFENVYDIFAEDDFTIVNLECVLTDSDTLNSGRTYNIKGAPEYAYILSMGSVEAVSMGNNHRLDFGESGTKDTLKALAPTGIVHAYDTVVGIYETKGVQIGFVSVNETSWGKGVEKLMKDGIDKLNEQDVDIILACCHWGIERESYPTEYQQQFGRMCIDWGADLVIGHHPHVLQGVEEYQGKYIVYSLANFCFGANRNPVDKDTMIAQQTFYFVDGQKQEETEFRMIPCSVSSIPSRNDYKPTPAVGEEAQRIIDRVNEYSQGFGVQFDENGYVIKAVG